jgi:hypothetical protein
MRLTFPETESIDENARSNRPSPIDATDATDATDAAARHTKKNQTIDSTPS